MCARVRLASVGLSCFPSSSGETTALNNHSRTSPPVSIPVVAKAGQVDITVTIGPVSVVVQPAQATVQIGEVLQLTATITAANGDVLVGPAQWATLNPAIATVDQSGVVTTLLPGQLQIVATFAGVGSASLITVSQDQIAFTSDRDGNLEIYVMNADGSNVARLTSGPASDEAPAWSPDGTQLAFASDRDGNWEIYKMNSDGGGLVRLTSNQALDFGPMWSPDGTKLAFTSDRDGNSEIYVIMASSGELVRLTNNTASDLQLSWSPDGNKIAFASDRDGVGDITSWEMSATRASGGTEVAATARSSTR